MNMIRIDRELIAILAIIFGILIIAIPELIAYLIGGYLLLFGIFTILGKKL